MQIPETKKQKEEPKTLYFVNKSKNSKPIPQVNFRYATTLLEGGSKHMIFAKAIYSKTAKEFFMSFEENSSNI